jgi:hypothetical protein
MSHIMQPKKLYLNNNKQFQVLVPNILGRNLSSGIFFIVSGITQIVWVLPSHNNC